MDIQAHQFVFGVKRDIKLAQVILAHKIQTLYNVIHILHNNGEDV